MVVRASLEKGMVVAVLVSVLKACVVELWVEISVSLVLSAVRVEALGGLVVDVFVASSSVATLKVVTVSSVSFALIVVRFSSTV